jgi:hypothetical protein
MTEMTMLTEFEENVSFDADDPDFAPPTTAVRNVLRARYFTDVKFDVGKGKHILMLLIVLTGSVSFYSAFTLRFVRFGSMKKL